ncbi:DUF3307 domain-containing protein, partial [Bacillus sp. JJ1764]|uniref:DUF3307 domain-containing protein n=1 Tax=Bacillus sp. JJ1764 TaxID=3122964 RepID=UPI002FFF3F67
MLLLSLILAHLIADFYLQTDAMVKEKLNHLKKHILHHFVITALVLIGSYFSNVNHTTIYLQIIIPLLVIVGSHYMIDLLKIKILDTLHFQNEGSIKRLGFFVLDQLLHLFVILLSSHYFIGIDMSKILSVFQVGHPLKPLNAILFILIIIILNTSVSGHMIRILLGSLPTQLLTFEGK